MNKFSSIIFDLDGTLIDSSKGIFNSVRYAEKMMGFNPIGEDRLKEFVGPPPKKMYADIYNVSEKAAIKATQFHREYGKKYAIYESEVYCGMCELLKCLSEKGYKISVATLKSQNIAEKILEHHGLKKYFSAIVGMDEEETLTKVKTIQLAMDKVGVKDKALTLMVGDTYYDLQGAQEVGISFIPALYGFGFTEPIIKNGVYAFINKPLDLLKILEE